jgi:Xaa-Pro aminopeptidase
MIDYPSRRSRISSLLAAHNLDALVVFGCENLRYFAGFTGTSGVLIMTAGQTVFLTDSRYVTQAKAQVAAEVVEEYKAQTEGLVVALSRIGAERIGFEETLAYALVEELKQKGADGWCWEPVGRELLKARLYKSAHEVAEISEAARLNAEAFAEILPLIRPGKSERELALQLEFALKRRGAEEKAFDFIVASGERGALPHGVASDRILCTGELVTFDFGCRVNGYHSDETLTLALGEPDPELRNVFDLVLRAHDRALAAVAPGIALADLDKLAREVIAEAGYGDFFGHGLGHGVGLEVHEAPTVSPRSTAIAEEGMVFTIEPGIYLPGRGGVRIEDMVLVTADGYRRLTSLPKEFRDILES